jgi:hypothetical protein
MSKRNRKSAEQTMQQMQRDLAAALLRSAEQARVDHSPEQVKEVALMLYAQRPFPLNNSVKTEDFDLLVRQAFDFLDNLDNAYALALKWRENRDAVRRKALRVRALGLKLATSLKPGECVPFNKAVMLITGEKHRHVDRAEERFEAFPFIRHPRNFSGALGFLLKRPLLWREQIALWRKNGMTRDEVIKLHSLYSEELYHFWRDRWRRWRVPTTGKQAKKRRAPWSKKRLEKTQSESAAREVKRQEKVKALRKAARTGEIE